MIEITFNPDEHEVILSGHAGVEERGKDIVCSAVSILFYTLCEGITKLKYCLEEEPVISMADGDGKVSCKPTESGRASIEMVYWSILNGFELLAESYPDAVKIG